MKKKKKRTVIGWCLHKKKEKKDRDRTKWGCACVGLGLYWSASGCCCLPFHLPLLLSPLSSLLRFSSFVFLLSISPLEDEKGTIALLCFHFRDLGSWVTLGKLRFYVGLYETLTLWAPWWGPHFRVQTCPMKWHIIIWVCANFNLNWVGPKLDWPEFKICPTMETFLILRLFYLNAPC